MTTSATAINRFSTRASDSLQRLLSRYDMTVQLTPGGVPIPGSFWGDEEAGLIANTLILRPGSERTQRTLATGYSDTD